VTPESILAAPRFLELLIANCCDSKWAEERGSQILEGVEQASDGMSRIGRRLRPRSRAKPGIRACQILFAMLVLMAANLPVAKAGTGSALPAVAGDSGSKEFTITVLPSGTEMEYSGRIEFSSSGALRSALNGNPAVKILHLTSNGGSVGYGRKMEYLVHDRGLTTVVDAHCACYFILYPERAPAGFAADDVLAGDEWKDFADLQARLVSDGALRNAAVPSKSDVDAALAAMAQQLRQQNPNLASALSNLDSPTSDHGAACSAMTEMLAAILTLPFRQKGPLVRYVFGSY